MPEFEVIARDRRDLLGEGPLWSERERALYWVDILDPTLGRLSLSDMSVTSTPLPQPTGWVIERQSQPGFVAGAASGFVELELEPLAMTPITGPEILPGSRMNDAKADAFGRIWAGAMGNAGTGPGSLYCLSPDRTWRREDQDYVIPNGPAISPDGRSFFHTDSHLRRVYRYDLEEDGGLANRRLFLEFPEAWGEPDGMTFDAEGCLWIAHWGASCISRFSITAKREQVIALPTPQITSMAFAGAGLDRLFVTSAAIDRLDDPMAGALFEVEPGVKGLAPFQFAG